MLVPHAHYVVPTSFPDILKHIGYATNLQLAVDMGDKHCYSGSGASITDQSTAVRNLTFGTVAGADASDPTFVGTAGLQTSGQYVRFPDYDDVLSSTADAFSHSLHKNNAVFTLATWARVSAYDAANGHGLFTTVSIAAGLNGMLFGIGRAGVELSLTFANAGAAEFIDTNVAAPVGSIAFYAISYNEATGAWIARSNGNTGSGTQAIVSPSAVNADTGLNLASTGNPSGGYSGDVFAAAAWSSALSSADLLAIYDATRTKYGL
jgi:hypothetical protein